MSRILLVDDESDVVARNAASLEAAGFDVVATAGTAAALDAIGRDRPDLIVLEAMLDGSLAGFDLARRLAAECPSLPLIMLSRVDQHLSRAELAREDRDDGWIPVDRFLEKPVMPDVLAYEVEHLLHVGTASKAGRA